MKIKKGGDWFWIKLKYERLSTFCFICGILGHPDRTCPLLYVNPTVVFDKSYGVTLHAPNRRVANQVGANG